MPSALPPPGSENHLFLVDLSGYVFRAYHAIAPLSSTKGEPTHAVLGTANMLHKIVNERKPHSFAVAMDSKGPTFRHAMDERYKANRPAPPPDLSQQMKRCEEIVRAYNIPIYQMPGMEADDLIASVARRAMDAGMKIIIVSSDKDLMQLVHDDDDRVLLWDTMRDKVFGAQEVKDKWGVLPSHLRDLLALVGDSSDNIPGVPGVGPKTAADLLASYDTVAGVYENLDKVTKPKLKESLKTHEADARLSYDLVGLKSDIDVAWDAERLVYGQPDVPELRRLFTELEFTRFLDMFRPTETQKREFGTILTREALEAFAARVRKTKLLVLGLATTHEDGMRAACFGLSLSSAPGEGLYLPMTHRYLGAPKQLGWDAVREVLGPLLRDHTIKKVGHDLKRDELIVTRQGLSIEGPIFDTMLASYLLDAEGSSSLAAVAKRELGMELLPYVPTAAKGQRAQVDFDEIEVEKATQFAAAEVLACASVDARYEPRIDAEGLGPLMRDVELPLSRVLAEMEKTGVLVDTQRLEVIGKRAEGELAALEARAKEVAGREFAIRSRDQLETILFDELKLPVLKKTPKGGRSTDASVLEELAEQHELPKIICEYREIDKLKGTYVDALPRVILPATGRIHTTYEQAVAATGRLSSQGPNLQNIPIRTALGREIRSAFVAPAGHVILAADYSQVELRLLAHLSQDPGLLEAFRKSEDVHVHTASLIFDVPKDKVTKVMRGQAKTVNFGVIYGMGDAALAKQTGVTRAEATRFIEAYFTRYAGVKRFMDETVAKARSGEAVRTLLGRRRFLPNIHSANRGLRTEAERVAKNTPIQGTAADLMKLAMVKLGARPNVPGAPGVKMVMTVHDELVFEVKAEHVEKTGAFVRDAMANAMKLDVPLVVDVGHGPSWADAH
jgi:DNA polymerase I